MKMGFGSFSFGLVYLGICLWFGSVATAGDGAGNGDVVVCFAQDGSLMSVELLDFFERRNDRDFEMDLGGPNLTVDEKVSFALEKLTVLDPERKARYSQIARDFESKVEMVQTPLEDYHDVGHVVLPPHCKLDQVAIQHSASRQRRYAGLALKKPIKINEILWKLLRDDDHRAGLKLHEIIYGEALALGHRTSDSVRAMTALLSSTSGVRIGASDYSGLVAKFISTTLALNLSDRGEILFEIRAGELFRNNLNGALSGGTGRVTWSSPSGRPRWVTINAQGLLTGTPQTADVGDATFQVVVRDEEKGALGTVRLRVLP